MNPAPYRQMVRGFFAVTASFVALVTVGPAVAQVPQTIPNGLPEWAFNIPDKVQPPTTPMKGPVQLPGSSKVYDASETAISMKKPVADLTEDDIIDISAYVGSLPPR